jgi:hypothetical protein
MSLTKTMAGNFAFYSVLCPCFSPDFNSQFKGKTNGYDLPSWYFSQKKVEFSENKGEVM